MESDTEESVDLASDRVFYLGWGLVFRAVCAPKSMSKEDIEDFVSSDDPPGTSANRWVISEPDESRTDDFKGTNCVQCPDCESRQHWLMNC